MPNISQSQTLGKTGSVAFRLTPTSNNTNRLYLLDFGFEEANRITLVVLKDGLGNRFLQLEIVNSDGQSANWSEPFPDFKIGLSFDVELVWSSERNLIAVFIGDNKDPIILKKDSIIKFNNLGAIIHYGENIKGDGQTEMDCSPQTQNS